MYALHSLYSPPGRLQRSGLIVKYGLTSIHTIHTFLPCASSHPSLIRASPHPPIYLGCACPFPPSRILPPLTESSLIPSDTRSPLFRPRVISSSNSKASILNSIILIFTRSGCYRPYIFGSASTPQTPAAFRPRVKFYHHRIHRHYSGFAPGLVSSIMNFAFQTRLEVLSSKLEAMRAEIDSLRTQYFMGTSPPPPPSPPMPTPSIFVSPEQSSTLPRNQVLPSDFVSGKEDKQFSLQNQSYFRVPAAACWARPLLSNHELLNPLCLLEIRPRFSQNWSSNQNYVLPYWFTPRYCPRKVRS